MHERYVVAGLTEALARDSYPAACGCCRREFRDGESQGQCARSRSGSLLLLGSNSAGNRSGKTAGRGVRKARSLLQGTGALLCRAGELPFDLEGARGGYIWVPGTQMRLLPWLNQCCCSHLNVSLSDLSRSSSGCNKNGQKSGVSGADGLFQLWFFLAVYLVHPERLLLL